MNSNLATVTSTVFTQYTTKKPQQKLTLGKEWIDQQALQERPKDLPNQALNLQGMEREKRGRGWGSWEKKTQEKALKRA